uniref:Uncharacterized protein n=1 Tax=Sus scrofa TaxID=9823 RepID=A0A8D1V6L0_PIG
MRGLIIYSFINLNNLVGAPSDLLYSVKPPENKNQSTREASAKQLTTNAQARDLPEASHVPGSSKFPFLSSPPLGTEWKLPIPLGPVYPHLISSLSNTKPVERSWELSPPTAKSFRMHNVHVAHLPQQGPFQCFMDMKAEKRLAGRKERRSHFGDISVHKCDQFGQIFCPFQALATTVSSLGGDVKAEGHRWVQKQGHFKRRKRSGYRGDFCDKGRCFWLLSF